MRHLLRHWLEHYEAPLNLARLLSDPAIRGAGVAYGDGKPVLLAHRGPWPTPGQSALTAWLNGIGYRAEVASTAGPGAPSLETGLVRATRRAERAAVLIAEAACLPPVLEVALRRADVATDVVVMDPGLARLDWPGMGAALRLVGVGLTALASDRDGRLPALTTGHAALRTASAPAVGLDLTPEFYRALADVLVAIPMRLLPETPASAAGAAAPAERPEEA